MRAYLAMVVIPHVGMSSVDPVERILSPGRRKVAGSLGCHQPLVVGEQVIQQELGPTARLEARLQAAAADIWKNALLPRTSAPAGSSCYSMDHLEKRHQSETA